ncbi:hypothetical protein BT93_H2247 [Corymbia citriodora subsp. variegata]|nr:hypothetical protein BT93_H2247 [Corymbia citriodora subsp. variegata]
MGWPQPSHLSLVSSQPIAFLSFFVAALPRRCFCLGCSLAGLHRPASAVSPAFCRTAGGPPSAGRQSNRARSQPLLSSSSSVRRNCYCVSSVLDQTTTPTRHGELAGEPPAPPEPDQPSLFLSPFAYFGCTLPHRNRICRCFDGTVTQHRRQPPSAREPPRPTSTPTNQPAASLLSLLSYVLAEPSRLDSLDRRRTAGGPPPATSAAWPLLASVQPPGTAALRPSPSRLLLDRASPGRDPFPQPMASTQRKRPCIRLTTSCGIAAA